MSINFFLNNHNNNDKNCYHILFFPGAQVNWNNSYSDTTSNICKYFYLWFIKSTNGYISMKSKYRQILFYQDPKQMENEKGRDKVSVSDILI